MPISVCVPVPERVRCVKGHLADFLAHGQRISPLGAFSVVPRLFLGLRTSYQCRSRSSFSRLSSRSFPRGCTPTHPFVNPSAENGGRSGPQEPDTQCSAATVSRCKRRLNQNYARQSKPSPRGHSDWLCRRGPLLLQKKGRCNLPLRFRSPGLRFSRVPAGPRRFDNTCAW